MGDGPAPCECGHAPTKHDLISFKDGRVRERPCIYLRCPYVNLRYAEDD